MLDFSVTFAITIINLIILFLILRLILFKPITKFMAERAKKVQDIIDSAQKERTEARELLASHEEQLKNIKNEADEILRAARENAVKEAELIIKNSKQEAANLMAQMQKQLETERLAALAKFNVEAALLVMAASSKLAAREISGEDSRRYANMLLDELAGQKNLL